MFCLQLIAWPSLSRSAERPALAHSIQGSPHSSSHREGAWSGRATGLAHRSSCTYLLKDAGGGARWPEGHASQPRTLPSHTFHWEERSCPNSTKGRVEERRSGTKIRGSVSSIFLLCSREKCRGLRGPCGGLLTSASLPLAEGLRQAVGSK